MHIELTVYCDDDNIWYAQNKNIQNVAYLVQNMIYVSSSCTIHAINYDQNKLDFVIVFNHESCVFEAVIEI